MTRVPDSVLERLRPLDPVVDDDAIAWADSPSAEAIYNRILAGEPRRAAVGRRPLAMRAAVLAVAAAAIVAALVVPFDGRDGGVAERVGIVERALAAVGAEGPVLHFVIRHDVADATHQRIDVASGAASPVGREVETEVWYDAANGTLRQIDRREGVVINELVWDRDGAMSTRGPIETKPGQEPTFGAALPRTTAAYRAALEDGAARVVGEATVGGRSVYWLEYRLPIPAPEGGVGTDHVERVAIDAATYEPVALRRIVDGDVAATADVVSYESVGRGVADFSRPDSARYANGAEVVAEEPIAAAAAADVLGRRPPLPATVAGRALRGVTHLRLASHYWVGGGNESRSGEAIKLGFGDLDVFVMARPEPALGFNGPTVAGGTPLAPEGQADVLPYFGGLQAFARVNGLYVLVRSDGHDSALLIDALRTLRG
jgi:hypothetical protein